MAERRAPLEYNRLWQMRAWLLAVFFFLYAPLVALIVFSFNDSKRTTVWRGFTFKYYEKLFGNDSLLLAFANSLTIAFVATIISLVIGALAAVLLWRYRFTGKTVVEGVVRGLLAAGHPANQIILWDEHIADLRRAGFVVFAGRPGWPRVP